MPASALNYAPNAIIQTIVTFFSLPFSLSLLVLVLNIANFQLLWTHWTRMPAHHLICPLKQTHTRQQIFADLSGTRITVRCCIDQNHWANGIACNFGWQFLCSLLLWCACQTHSINTYTHTHRWKRRCIQNALCGGCLHVFNWCRN